MEDISFISKIFIVLFLAGSFGMFAWIGLVVYLKSKWLLYLEDELDEGVRFYSLTLKLAGHGVLQYATVFLSSFHAKRYGMLEKRNKVPKHVRRLFIFAFALFMLSCTLMVTSYVLVEFYDI